MRRGWILLLERTGNPARDANQMRVLASYLETSARTARMLGDLWKTNPAAYDPATAQRILRTLDGVVEVLKGKWG